MISQTGLDVRLGPREDFGLLSPFADQPFSDGLVYAITNAASTVTPPAGLTLPGTSGNDTLTGGAGNDLLQGGAGNDTLVATRGSDTLDGGTGTNTAVFNLDTVWSGGLPFDGSKVGSGAPVDLTDGSGQTTQLVNIQNLVITGHTHGPILGDVITGGTGNDTITGGPGDNILNDGGGLFNTLNGGPGDNIFYVNSLLDHVNAQPGGYNTIFSSAIITLPANVQALYLTGAVASAVGNGLDNMIVGDNGANYVQGLAGNDTIAGAGGNDRIDGGTGNDTIDGGAGINTAVYHLDTDWTAGQAFDGSAVGPSGAPVTFNGGPGNDDTLVNIQNLEIWGFASAPNHIVGSAGNDTIRGGSGNDYLDGGAGYDLLAGGAGDDSYIVDNVADRVYEYANQGYDTVYASITYTLPPNVEALHLGGQAYAGTGNALDNLIAGTDSGNLLRGQGGNDTLVGGAGNDTLDGGPGADTLTGGGGNNIFVERKGETDSDTITDFKTGHDQIELTGWGAGSTVTLTDPAHNGWTVTDGIDHSTSLLTIVGTVVPTDIIFA